MFSFSYLFFIPSFVEEQSFKQFLNLLFFSFFHSKHILSLRSFATDFVLKQNWAN